MEENQIPHKKKYIALIHHHDSKINVLCDLGTFVPLYYVHTCMLNTHNVTHNT